MMHYGGRSSLRKIKYTGSEKLRPLDLTTCIHLSVIMFFMEKLVDDSSGWSIYIRLAEKVVV